MKYDREYLEVLRNRLGNRGDTEVPDSGSQVADDMYRSIVDRVDKEQPGRRPRRLVLAVASVTIVLAGATYAVFYIPVSYAVACFASATVNSDQFASQDPNNPLGTCTQAWQRGDLVNPAVAPGDVPPLISCVGEDEPVWIFPALDGETCHDLGLAGVDLPSP